MPYRPRDNVTESLRKDVLKVTGENFDGDEINEYIAMALDYLDACDGLCFNEKEFFKWLKYKVIRTAYTVIGLNESIGHNGQIIRRGLKPFDSKLSTAILKKGDRYEKKCSDLECSFRRFSSSGRIKEMKKLNESQKQAKLEGNSKKRVKILKTMSNIVKNYTELAKTGNLH